MKTLTLLAMSVMFLVILFQCCPCTALPLAIPTPTMSVLQGVRATLTAEARAIAPQATPTDTPSPGPQPTAINTAAPMATPTSPTLPTPVPPPTPTPTPVPTFTPVAIGPMQLGQFGTYNGLSISVLWREWADFRMVIPEFRIDAQPAHHILWIHVRAENRTDRPVDKPIEFIFDVWHQGRQVDGISESSPESDPHQPPLECGPYSMMNPGEVCEGWLCYFPDIPDDWSREDLLVSYGELCDSESAWFPPCLYWRLE